MEEEKKNETSAPHTGFVLQHSSVSIRPLDNQMHSVFDVPFPLLDVPHLYIISAPKGKGKTTLILNMLLQKDLYKKKFNRVYIVSKSVKKDKKWDKVAIRKENLYDRMDDTILTKIFKQLEDGLKENPKRQSLLIFDDMISDGDLFNNNRNNLMNNFYYNHRHDKASIWVCSQKFKNFPTGLRQNVDALFIYEQNNDTTLHQIWEEYAQDLNWPDFLSLYEFCTRDHHFLFIRIDRRTIDSGRYSKDFSVVLSIPRTDHVKTKRKRGGDTIDRSDEKEE